MPEDLRLNVKFALDTKEALAQAREAIHTIEQVMGSGGGNSTKMRTGIDGVYESLAKLVSQFDVLKAKKAEYAASPTFPGQKGQINELNSLMIALSKNIQGVTREYATLSTTQNKLSRTTGQGSGALNMLNASRGELAQYQGKLVNKQAKGGIVTDAELQKLKRLKENFEGAKVAAENFVQAVASGSQKVKAEVGVALVNAIDKAKLSTNQLDKSFDRVFGAAGKAKIEQFARGVKMQFSDMSRTVSRAMDKVNDSVKQSTRFDDASASRVQQAYAGQRQTLEGKYKRARTPQEREIVSNQISELEQAEYRDMRNIDKRRVESEKRRNPNYNRSDQSVYGEQRLSKAKEFLADNKAKMRTQGASQFSAGLPAFEKESQNQLRKLRRYITNSQKEIKMIESGKVDAHPDKLDDLRKFVKTAVKATKDIERDLNTMSSRAGKAGKAGRLVSDMAKRELAGEFGGNRNFAQRMWGTLRGDRAFAGQSANTINKSMDQLNEAMAGGDLDPKQQAQARALLAAGGGRNAARQKSVWGGTVRAPIFQKMTLGSSNFLRQGFSGMFGAGKSPFGNRMMGSMFHRANTGLSHASALMGMPIYGMGMAGAGVMGVKSALGLAQQAEAQQLTLSGLVNTFMKFDDAGTGDQFDKGKNFSMSRDYSKQLYGDIRKKARRSILTTPELFDFFMAGGSTLMSKGVGAPEAIDVVDKMATLGKAMGLRNLDVQQDIRALASGDVRATNKLGKLMGFTGPEIKASFEEGPGAFMEMFQKKFEGFETAMAEMPNTLQGTLNVLLDSFQQLGMDVGEKIMPIIIPALKAFGEAVMGLKEGGDLDGIAANIGSIIKSMIEGLTWAVTHLEEFTDRLKLFLQVFITYKAVATMSALTNSLGPAISGIGALSTAIVAFTAMAIAESRRLAAQAFSTATEVTSTATRSYEEMTHTQKGAVDIAAAEYLKTGSAPSSISIAGQTHEKGSRAYAGIMKMVRLRTEMQQDIPGSIAGLGQDSQFEDKLEWLYGDLPKEDLLANYFADVKKRRILPTIHEYGTVAGLARKIGAQKGYITKDAEDEGAVKMSDTGAFNFFDPEALNRMLDMETVRTTGTFEKSSIFQDVEYLATAIMPQLATAQNLSAVAGGNTEAMSTRIAKAAKNLGLKGFTTPAHYEQGGATPKTLDAMLAHVRTLSPEEQERLQNEVLGIGNYDYTSAGSFDTEEDGTGSKKKLRSKEDLLATSLGLRLGLLTGAIARTPALATDGAGGLAKIGMLEEQFGIQSLFNEATRAAGVKSNAKDPIAIQEVNIKYAASMVEAEKALRLQTQAIMTAVTAQEDQVMELRRASTMMRIQQGGKETKAALRYQTPGTAGYMTGISNIYKSEAFAVNMAYATKIDSIDAKERAMLAKFKNMSEAELDAYKSGAKTFNIPGVTKEQSMAMANTLGADYGAGAAVPPASITDYFEEKRKQAGLAQTAGMFAANENLISGTTTNISAITNRKITAGNIASGLKYAGAGSFGAKKRASILQAKAQAALSTFDNLNKGRLDTLNKMLGAAEPGSEKARTIQNKIDTLVSRRQGLQDGVVKAGLQGQRIISAEGYGQAAASARFNEGESLAALRDQQRFGGVDEVGLGRFGATATVTASYQEEVLKIESAEAQRVSGIRQYVSNMGGNAESDMITQASQTRLRQNKLALLRQYQPQFGAARLQDARFGAGASALGSIYANPRSATTIGGLVGVASGALGPAFGMGTEKLTDSMRIMMGMGGENALNAYKLTIPEQFRGDAKGYAKGYGMATIGGGIAGNFLGRAIGGSQQNVQTGQQIGGALASLGAFANIFPNVPGGGQLFGLVAGGLIGGLFGKKKKKDPREEQHRKRIEDLLSRIDKSLRPQNDYFRTVNRDVLFGSASRYLSGRFNENSSSGLQRV